MNADAKTQQILDGLKKGLERQIIAKEMGYGNWRSLDMFMRRKGLIWDGKKKTYEAELPKRKNQPYPAPPTSPKIPIILAKFKDKDADPKKIAEDVGFEDHHELSTFMTSRGYTWSAERNNYFKAAEAEDKEPESHVNTEDEDFRIMVKMLMQHKDKLKEMSAVPSAPNSIPRYAVPGITRTKSFYMSDQLSNLVNEFSRLRNIRQKEVVEAALIEYLRRYSFNKEVDFLMDGLS